jgi:hypothetical protein
LAAAALLLGSATGVQAQRSAYKPSSSTDALESVAAYLGPRTTSRIVSMQAEEGRPEPLYWEIVLLEPSASTGRRVLRAGGGQVFYDKVPLGLPGNRGLTPVLNIPKMKLDSGRAFKVAEKLAARNRIAFNHANYELLATAPDAPPVWIVSLVDDVGDTVGKVDINSSTGNVLRDVWNPAKILPPDGAPRRSDAANQPGPPTKGRPGGQGSGSGRPGQGPPPQQQGEGGTLEGVGRSLDRGIGRLKRIFD